MSARWASRPQNKAVSIPGAIGEEEVGLFGRHGAAGIDHHDAGAALAPVLHHALEQHRVAPRRVRADQHDEIRLIEILVDAGNRIGAEGAAMAGDRRGHAQAGIGVHVGGADEALHQLVGDVVVLGEQLAREIERDGIGTVALDDPLEAIRNAIERRVPIDARERAVRLPQHGMQQASAQAERLTERRALRAQPAEIRRMLGIAGDVGAATSVRLGQDSAADAAIGAGACGWRVAGTARSRMPPQYTSC